MNSGIINTIQESSFNTSFPKNVDAGYAYQLQDNDVLLGNENSNYINIEKDHRFYNNLAMYLSEGELNKIGNDLTNSIESDNAARQNWLNIVVEGVEYLGIGKQRNKNAYSAKSTDIFAPTLMKAALNSSSNIFSYMFPANGFADMQVMGLIDKSKEEHADRVREFFNYIKTYVMDDYEADKKQGLFWMVLEGSMFVKPYICPLKDKPIAPYIRASDIIIDSGASSLEDAERISHEFSISARGLEDRFNTDWRRINIEQDTFQSNLVRNKSDQKIGIVPIPDDKNKYHSFYETLCFLDIKGFEHINQQGYPSGRKLPYLVTKDKNSDSIVSIYRHWDENDPRIRPKRYLIQHKFFTGFNIYGLGLFHLALGLAKAETEIQQQLIKAAQLSNAPSLLMESTLRNEKTQIDIKPGSLNQFQTFGSNLANSLMPLPFKEPSQVLLQLKDFLSSSINDFAATFELKPENMPANMSASAVLGVLNSNMMQTLENALLKGLYQSFQKEFQFIYDLIGEWLPEEGYPFKLPGSEGVMMKEDFGPDISIRPVLDPNLSSRAHKLIVGEGIMGLAAQAPDLYNMREVHSRLLNSMQVNNVDQLLLPDVSMQTPPPPPAEMDPISENKTVMEGNPIKPYKTQDHTSHIIVHNNAIDLLNNDQTIDHTNIIAELKSHIQAHTTLQYIINMELMTGLQFPDDPTQIPQEMQNEIAIKAAQKVKEEKEKQLALNPPPPDPNEILMEENRIKEKAIDAKSHETLSRLNLDEIKMNKEAENESLKLQIQLKQLDLTDKELMIQEKKLMVTQEEIQLKLRLELEKIKLGENKTDLETQSKAFDSTLKYQKDQEMNNAKIASEEQKSSLDAQSKAFDSTLDFEKKKLDFELEENNFYNAGTENG